MRGDIFLCWFSPKSVEMNGLSVGGFLFGMVIWGNVLLDVVVVEIVVVETVDVAQVWFFIFFWRGCMEDMMGVRLVIEVVVGVVVSVSVVELFCSVRIGLGVGGVGNRRGSVVSGGGDASVADGGGTRWRNCCRFPGGIFGEPQEDLPYRRPFTLDIIDFFS